MDRKQAKRQVLTVDEARSRILATITLPIARSANLLDALGLTLATTIAAESDSPRFDAVAMDGYAIRSADIRLASTESPVRMPVVGVVQAGVLPSASVAPGSAVRVMTGAILPDGADAVVPLELAEEHDGTVEFKIALPAESNFRRQGEDFRVGDVLVGQGTELSPAHAGLIAAEGLASVDVFPRPRVAVIATGDELVAPGQALEPGQIWDSNSIAVAGLVRQFGGEPVSVKRVADEVAALEHLLAAEVSAGAELIVTAGGASRGDRDVLAELTGDGIEIDLADVRMKPGRPLAFGSFRGVPLIGLPGNPVAAFVSALQFVRPALRKMLGRASLDPHVLMATVGTAIVNPGGRRNFLRVRLSWGPDGAVAQLAGAQGVANLSVLAKSHGLLVIPESVARLEARDSCEVQLFDQS